MISDTRKDASPQQGRSKTNTDTPVDESQWVVVKPPTNVNSDGTFNEEEACNQDHIHSDSTSAHFELHLGWRRWKWKVLNIDYNRTKTSGNHGSGK
jgi:hypothetical protein